MPIPEEMNERVRSRKVADIAQHDWVRWGGGLYAAAFLREFVDGIPWGHLDIAGPGFNPGGGARLHAERWHRLRDRDAGGVRRVAGLSWRMSFGRNCGRMTQRKPIRVITAQLRGCDVAGFECARPCDL